jgi:hypothetical protein
VESNALLSAPEVGSDREQQLSRLDARLLISLLHSLHCAFFLQASAIQVRLNSVDISSDMA